MSSKPGATLVALVLAVVVALLVAPAVAVNITLEEGVLSEPYEIDLNVSAPAQGVTVSTIGTATVATPDDSAAGVPAFFPDKPWVEQGLEAENVAILPNNDLVLYGEGYVTFASSEGSTTSFVVSEPVDACVATWGSITYVAVANYRAGSNYRISSPIFANNGAGWTQVDAVETLGGQGCAFNVLDDALLLAFANSHDSSFTTSIQSFVYVLQDGSFQLRDTAATIGAQSVAPVTAGDAVGFVFGNVYDSESQSSSVASHLWLYDSNQLLESGASLTVGATHDVSSVTCLNNQSFVAVALQATGSFTSSVAVFSISPAGAAQTLSVVATTYAARDVTLFCDAQLSLLISQSEVDGSEAASAWYDWSVARGSFVAASRSLPAAQSVDMNQAGHIALVDRLASSRVIVYDMVRYSVADVIIHFANSQLYLDVEDDDEDEQSESLVITLAGASPAEIYLTLLDNDVTLFTVETLALNVSEDVANGTIVYTSLSNLVNSSGTVQFQLEDTTRTFAILGDDLILTQTLDRETIDSYLVRLEASQAGVDGVDALIIEVSVLDVNDNAPAYSQSAYYLFFNENSSVGTSLAMLPATDADLHAALVYSLSSSSQFALDSLTANLTSLVVFDADPVALSPISLQMTASDGTFSSSAAVTVVILDVNDNAPVFDQVQYQVTVPESTATGTQLARVQATDADRALVNRQLKYTLLNATDIVRVAASTGAITLIGALDYESQTSFVVAVQASDSAATPQRTTVYFRLLVSDVNDNGPRFSALSANFSFPESTTVGTTVFTTSAADPDTVGPRPTYSSNNLPAFFSLNSQSGALVLSIAVDYETAAASYAFEIVATDADNGLTATQSIQVQLLDVNDNAPEFVGSTTEFDVLESASVETVIARIEVRDADSGANGNVTLSIDATFSDAVVVIHPTTGVVSLTSSLDYEQDQEYFFRVLARDAGSPQQETIRDFRINVLDVNDNTPVADDLAISVWENATVGSVLAWIDARDADLTPAFRNISFTTNSPVVSIDSEGRVILEEALDYEADTFYEVTVFLSDGRFVSSMLLSLTVLDVNDNRPIFDGLPSSITLAEDLVTGTSVLTVTALDLDSGVNAALRYTLASDESFLTIGSVSGILTLDSALDFESLSSFSVNVTVTDMGSPALSTTAILQVMVLDVNDNSPVFPNQTLSETVDENTAGSIAFSGATDADAGDNGAVTYALVNDFGGLFSLSGTSLTHAQLDAEVATEYSVVVRATDGGTPALSSDLVLVISVQDLNDEAPIIAAPSVLQFSVREDDVFPTNLSTLTISDADVTASNRESELEVSENCAAFVEVQDTLLILRTIPDETPQLQCSVTTRNLNDPAMATTSPLTINIELLNKYTPVFVNLTDTMTVLENQAVGTVVGQVWVEDADLDENGAITFALLNATSFFSIAKGARVGNTTSATLYSQYRFDREAQATYLVALRASDGGADTKSATVTITVQIGDLNDNPPQFDQGSYSVSVSEALSVGTTVLQLTASDADVGENAAFFFERVSGSASFNTTLAGAIQVIAPLDYETQTFHTLTVAVLDESGSGALRTVQIYIVDENDNSPVFGALSKVVITEATSPGTSIEQVFATDADSGMNAALTYSIVSVVPSVTGETPSSQLFAMAPTTGVVTTTAPLDFEKVKAYNITVQATDAGVPPRATTSVFTVELTDVNDNAPALSAGFALAYNVSEDSAVGLTLFAAMPVTDADSGLNAALSFTLSSPYFAINASTGGVTLAAPIDYEQVQALALNVLVTDGGVPTRTLPVSLAITVLDVNDNAPMASNASFSVREDASVNAVLGTVSVSDADTGSNFVFVVPPSVPVIIAGDGTVTLSEPLDREQVASYDVLVTVYDQPAAPRNSAQFRLVVTVTDVNDNVPAFDSSYLAVNVTESSNSITVLGPYLATDPDVDNAIVYNLVQDGVVATRNATGHLLLDPLDRETVSAFNLTLVAFNPDKPASQGRLVIAVTVTDINDNVPEIPAAQLTNINVIEENTTGVLRTFAPVDADEGINAVITLSLANDYDGRFVLSPTYELSLTQQLDREAFPNGIDLVITVQDAGTPSLNSSASVHVNIIDVSDNAPVFANNTYTFSLPEGTYATSSVVGQVTATSSDSGANADVAYSVSPTTRFRINASTGVISTQPNMTFDRETIASHTLTVSAVSGPENKPLVAQVAVTVAIADINDNTPVLMAAPASLTLSEATAVGTTLHTFEATDADAGVNAALTWSLQDTNNGRFSINENGELKLERAFDFEAQPYHQLTVVVTDGGIPARSASTNMLIILTDANDETPQLQRCKCLSADQTNGAVAVSNTGVITLAKALDRETMAVLRFDVLVTDTGEPPLSNSTSIMITVSDVNDNAPAFADSDISIGVAEDEAIGFALVQLVATDADSGINAAVTLSVDAVSAERFHIDNDGYLRLSQRLDYEVRRAYNVTITATDGGFPALSSTALVRVHVTDVDDNAAVIVDPGVAIMAEDAPVQATVAILHFTDADTGINAQGTWSITAQTSAGQFGINASSGRLVLLKALDFEMLQEHEVSVQVTNQATGLASSVFVVEVDVTDVNDNAPICSESSYAFSIPENVANGVVGVITATDADSLGLSNASFVLNSSAFTVDSEGVVRTAMALDADNASSQYFSLSVIITDHQYPGPLSSVPCPVEITVVDVNDNAPLYTSSLSFVVAESAETGAVLGPLIFTDADSGNNGVVNVQLNNSHFAVSNNQLVLQAALDYEIVTSLAVAVQATDEGSPAQSTTVVVLVTVTDVNDNAPRFAKAEYTATINENVASAEVATLVVMDADNEPYAASHIFLNDSNTQCEQYLTVNSTSGAVALVAPLDYEVIQELSCTVAVVNILPLVGSAAAEPWATTLVRVSVVDLDDNAPAFTSVPDTVTVPENVPRGTIVHVFTGADADVFQSPAFSFVLALNTGAAPVTLAPNGTLYTSGDVDHEQLTEAPLIIRIQDDNNPLYFADANVTLLIEDVNDNAPVFNNANTLDVLEELSVGTTLSLLNVTDADAGANSQITYSILDSGSRLGINSTTGELRVLRRLNRESTDALVIIVTATDGGAPPRSTSQTITIQLTDINDNVPTFLSLAYYEQVGELTPVNTTVLQVEAVDADINDNAAIEYLLFGAAGSYFNLNSTTGTLAVQQSLLPLVGTTVTLEIMARHPIVTSSRSARNATVVIQILNENENAPVFQSSADISVLENVTTGTVIGQMVATDADEGANGEVRYSLTQGGSFVSIDAITGVLTLRSGLDYETRQRVEVTVVARDQGAIFQSSSVTFALIIVDVNDNGPQFAGTTATFSVLENTRATFMGLQVTDADSVPDFSLAIVDDITGVFAILPNATITMSDSLDREVVATVVFRAVATDSLGRTSQVTVTVTVLDENDNAPTFPQAVVNSTVREGDTLPSLGYVTATDADSGVNGQLTYSILSPTYGFTVDASTGLVTGTVPLDFETRPHLTLTIVATDGGSPALSSSVLVNVQVQDTNDHSPNFNASSITVTIDENVASDTLVVQVVATDLDANSILTYQLDAIGAALFNIDASSGEIFTDAPLDYEERQQVIMVVTAYDEDSRSDSITVVLNIRDLNDNVPVFSPSSYSTTVVETLQSDYLVAVVSATDADSGMYGTAGLQYSIVPSSGSHLFYLVGNYLYLRDNVDREVYPILNIMVQARDGGNLTATASVTVSMIDLNDNPPSFPNPNISLGIMENRPVGSFVGLANASDPDEGVNALIRYEMTGADAGLFAINTSTGAITTAAVFDREAREHYQVIVTARDAGNLASVFFDTATVEITILDENDNAPQIEQVPTAFTVREDAAVNTTLFGVVASDRDTGANAALRFELWNCAPATLMTCPFGFSGQQLLLIAPVDRETIDRYNLTVAVLDAAADAGPLNDTASVTVVIGDVNDNSPIFVQGVYNFSVAENTAPGVIGNVAATDADLGINALIRYESANASIASVGSDGTVYLVGHLDYEQAVEVSFYVWAFDSGNLSGSTLVHIMVQDVNDNAPVFSVPRIDIVLPENENRSSLASVVVTDADSGLNQQFDLSVTGEGAEYVVIERENATVRISVLAIDREEYSALNVSLLATDQGTPSQMSSLPISITVTDVNDNAPTGPATFEATVLENQPAGTIVARVPFTDADAGANGLLQFYLFDAATVGSNFLLQPLTGEIVTSRIFDREVQGRYEFRVIAQDSGTPSLSSTMNVTIIIGDLNDNRPRFTSTEFTAAVPEDINATVPALVLNATDADIGVNALLNFTLLSSDWADLFVDAGTGAIFLSADYETQTVITGTVKVENVNTTVSTYDVATFTINILDVNDVAPTVTVPTNVSVYENTLEAVILGSVTGTDPDTGLGGVITYSTNSSFFAINATTGVVTTIPNAPLDREAATVVELVIIATDGVHNTSATIFVTVLDRNDNPPIPTASVLYLEAAEDFVGELAIITGTDADEGANAVISYYIANSTAMARFAIDSVTGNLTCADLDYEESIREMIIVGLTDGLPGSNDSFVTINVNVTDVNDEAPVFDSTTYYDVFENEFDGAVVAQVVAFDRDTGSGGVVRYALTAADNCTAFFTVDPVTGVLETVTRLDRERQETFTCVVLAADQGSPSLSSTTTVDIVVLDRNDNEPSFEQTAYAFDVAELFLGQFASVSATDADTPANTNISFGLLEPSAAFGIDPLSGSLFTKIALDRETREMYELTLTVSDGQLSSTATALITVTDVNDNGPVVAGGTNGAVTENMPFNETVLQLIVTDADIGLNAEVNYTLLGNVSLFEMDHTGRLYTLGPLDRELQASYFLSVLVQNTAPPYFSTTATVSVTVLDINDNAPIFVAPPMSVSIPENAPLGLLPVELEVTDSDVGTNAQVTLSVFDPIGKIDIDASGQLLLIGELDREALAAFEIMIMAIDAGTPQLSTNITIMINVEDVNDNAPVFEQLVYEYDVPEDLALGPMGLYVHATESDLNETTTYAVEDNNYLGVNSSSGELILLAALDRESFVELFVQVSATDVVGNNATARVELTITDVNDNAPVFDLTSYSTSISEGQTGALLSVSATDADEGLAGTAGIRFRLVDNPNNLSLTVDATSGLITLTAAIDYEVLPNATFVVEAYNLLDSSLATSVEVTVVVLDVNDNAPAFTDGITSVSVTENAPLSTVMAQFTASDVDVSSTLLSFYLRSADGVFAVGEVTGVLSPLINLDRETRAAYAIIVGCSDGSFTVEKTVQVSVLDQNDNEPLFVGTTPSNLSLSEGAAIGDVFYTFAATDADLNSNITFALVNTTRAGVFAVSPDGVLSLASLLDYENWTMATVVVRADDNGGPAVTVGSNMTGAALTPCKGHCTDHVIVLNVEDANDNAPQFAVAYQEITISESLTVGTPVAQVNASDADSGVNAEVRFSVTMGGSIFAIDAVSGVLSVSGTLDFESEETIQVQIMATDQGTPALTATATVLVQLTDFNDNAPRFVSNLPTSIMVAEDTTPSNLGVWAASDLDSGINAVLSYSLQNDFSGLFALQSTTGLLSLEQSLDYEMRQAYDLTIIVQDSGTPSLSTSMVLRINVGNVNDNAPVFVPVSQTLEVEENAEFVTLVTVQATDADGDVLRYRLQPTEHADAFGLQATSGVLVLRDALDYEAVQQVDLVIEAYDTTANPLRATLNLTIHILNVNDNAPVFSRQLYSVDVSESTAIGTTILTTTATDLDASDTLTYTVSGAPGVVVINSTSGQLSTEAGLDYEQMQSYTLTVVAEDQGGLVGTALVYVTVLDVNDNHPQFASSAYAGAVPENAAANTAIAMSSVFEATDADLEVGNVVSYALENSSALFRIEAETGILYTTAPLDAEVQRVYSLWVRAIDNGSPPLSSALVAVVINVTDLNDNSPVFMDRGEGGVAFTPAQNGVRAQYELTTADDDCTDNFELCDVGRVLLTVAASDLDVGTNADITFTFATASTTLAIDASSGAISLTAGVDREVTEELEVVVVATDGGSPARAVEALVRLSVEDRNDNSPAFLQDAVNLTLAENTPANSVLVTLTATDPDESGAATVNYFLVDASNRIQTHDSFVVGQSSGIVSTRRSLDYETDAPTYELRVAAVDQDENLAVAIVRVALLDVNDLAPTISFGGATTVLISEIVRSELPVGGLLLEDGDGSDEFSMSAVAWSVSPTTSAFSVSSDYMASGSVVPIYVSNLAYVSTATNTYTLTARASNVGGTPSSGSVARQYRVVPFIDAAETEDARAVRFNLQRPSICDEFPEYDACSSARRRRNTLNLTRVEVWMRRNYDCTPELCLGQEGETIAMEDGYCWCQIFGPANADYNASADTYELDGLLPSTSYQFQLREYDEGNNLVYSSRSYSRQTLDFNVDSESVTVRQLTSRPSFNVSWTAPSEPNGQILGYRLCYCAPSIPRSDCSCSLDDAMAVPASGYTDFSWVVVPDQGETLEVGVNYSFVVQTRTLLNNEVVAVETDPMVLNTVNQNTSSTGSTSSNEAASSALIAAIVVVAVLGLLILVLVVMFLRRKDARTGTSNLGPAIFPMEDRTLGASTKTVTIDLDTLKRDMLQDSMTSLDQTGLSASSGAAVNGLGGSQWNYMTQERAEQFWSAPDGGLGASQEEPELMETSIPRRSFGLNTVRVMADGVGGVQVRNSPLAPPRSAATPNAAYHQHLSMLHARFAGEERTPTTVDASYLEAVVEERRVKNQIDAEFDAIKHDSESSPFTFKAATETYNVKKNRYGNVLPIDDTRVLLSHTGQLGSDYINANYIPSWTRDNAFIASQGPIASTVGDFWRMIWETNSSSIIMMTREVEEGRLKCYKYWPEPEVPMRVGGYSIVALDYTNLSPEYGVRTLRLIDLETNEARIIKQFDYFSWPDGGAPPTAVGFIRFVLDVKQHIEAARSGNEVGPPVVHCSAGIGRTGTFLAMYALMQRLESLGNVDVAATVAYLRMYRAGLVQTVVQYRFLYEAIVTYYKTNPQLYNMTRAATAAAQHNARAQASLDPQTVYGASGATANTSLYSSTSASSQQHELQTFQASSDDADDDFESLIQTLNTIV
ncbi:uncharacterized protein MONBRDRAFT_22472 [Monosiga brevicollis MX1]|uniref:protein-tyrosine-phosphatase n=1 Tax=Monosiga brevicollis TaxID=81824 RepID=A9UQP1_MONBE|nr:uncharacterized protein MONBRDRAFT_22472 [Monosiga brevicollis MX1]EDQ93078.1 predicted protein [Monosiga brevicollis MX1]|eukprot:XP_001742840.1 hypothetical protein [Monosiga brevicollis MX1]